MYVHMYLCMLGPLSLELVDTSTLDQPWTVERALSGLENPQIMGET